MNYVYRYKQLGPGGTPGVETPAKPVSSSLLQQNTTFADILNILADSLQISWSHLCRYPVVFPDIL